MSHVVQMIQDACEAVETIGSSVMLLDRYFLSVPVLKTVRERQNKKNDLHIVTRAKSNCVGYYKPTVFENPKKGRPRKKGETVHLQDLFKNKEAFTETTLTLYGKEKKVSYFCIDLLWGKKLYQELRFILVRYADTEAILVSTNLNFTPEEIIMLYGFRSKIEVAFWNIKQIVHGFNSHFWSKSMPKLNRYLKKEDENPLKNISDIQEQRNIINALKAIEGFALFSCIAVGMLQLISLEFSHCLDLRSIRWLRTYSNNIHSEASIAYFLRKSFFCMFQKPTSFFIIRIIQDRQFSFLDDYELFHV